MKASAIGAFAAILVVASAAAAQEDESTGPATAVDPVTSSPTPGEPEISTPLLDVLAASVQTSEKDSVVRAVVAPFAFYTAAPILSETRVEIRTSTQPPSKWGASLSLGYSNIAERVRFSRLGDKTLLEQCAQEADKREEPVQLELGRLNAALRAELRKSPAGKAETDEIDAASPVEPRPKPIEDRAADRARRREEAEQLKRAYKIVRPDGENEGVDEAYKNLRQHGERHALALGRCFYGKSAKALMKHTYSAGYSARVSVGFDFYPFIDGPQIPDPAAEVGEGEDPVYDTAAIPDAVAGWNLQAAWGVFPAEHLRSWITLGVARKRADPHQASMGTWATGSADLAGNIQVLPTRSDGFAPGVAVGAVLAIRVCGEDAGCPTEIIGYDAKAALRGEYSVTPYVDLRADTKVQVRLSAPLQRFESARAIEGAAPEGRGVWAFAPTLSLTVASWRL